MSTWRSRTIVHATPTRVLDILTDAEACARWSPIPFDVDELDGARLRAGTTPRVSGRLLGRRLGFDLAVVAADPSQLRLVARGPMEILVDYALEPASRGCAVEAAVSVRPTDGRAGRLLAGAASVLLGRGMLEHALGRMAREAERGAPCAQCASA